MKPWRLAVLTWLRLTEPRSGQGVSAKLGHYPGGSLLVTALTGGKNFPSAWQFLPTKTPPKTPPPSPCFLQTVANLPIPTR